MRKEVSTIELLDMLDHSFVGMCQHRRTVARCKAAALQLLQNAIPGWLIINTDWAQNGWYPQRACCKASIGLRSPPAIHVSVGQYLSSEHWSSAAIVRQCARDTLHLRHWVTKAFFGLTNDRKQYAALKKALLALELS